MMHLPNVVVLPRGVVSSSCKFTNSCLNNDRYINMFISEIYLQFRLTTEVLFSTCLLYNAFKT